MEYFRKQHGITGGLGTYHRREYDRNGNLMVAKHKYRYCATCAVFMIFEEAKDVRSLRGEKRLFCHCCHKIVRSLSRTANHYKRNKRGQAKYNLSILGGDGTKPDPNLGKMLAGIKRDLPKWEALLAH